MLSNTFKLSSRLLVTLAVSSVALQPVAFAERGHGRGHDDYLYERHDDDYHGRGHYRGRGRGHHDRGHGYYEGYYRDSDYGDHYYRDDYRYRDYDRRSGVTITYSSRPFYGYSDRYGRDSDYRPRYSVGGSYRCHDRTRYITDYHNYGLYDPPRGYHWVRDDDSGDAILASVATGAIIGLIVGAIAYD